MIGQTHEELVNAVWRRPSVKAHCKGSKDELRRYLDGQGAVAASELANNQDDMEDMTTGQKAIAHLRDSGCGNLLRSDDGTELSGRGEAFADLDWERADVRAIFKGDKTKFDIAVKASTYGEGREAQQALSLAMLKKAHKR